MKEAMQILGERLARGDITAEEFKARLAVLKSAELGLAPTSDSGQTENAFAIAAVPTEQVRSPLLMVMIAAGASAFLGYFIEAAVRSGEPSEVAAYLSKLGYGLYFALLVGGVLRLYRCLTQEQWTGLIVATTGGYIAARLLLEAAPANSTADLAGIAAISSIVGALCVFVTLKRMRGRLFVTKVQWLLALALLSVIAAVTVAIAVEIKEPRSAATWPGDNFGLLLLIHAPWQVAFAWTIANALQGQSERSHKQPAQLVRSGART